MTDEQSVDTHRLPQHHPSMSGESGPDSTLTPPHSPVDGARGLPSHRILSVAEEELSRIILDIHDGPVQYLFTALSLLTGLQNDVAKSQEESDLSPRLAQVAMLLESSLYEIKFFLGTFRPPEFRSRSLVSIVQGLVIQHEEWTGNTVDLRTKDVPDDMTLPVKIALYRILQEALSNAYRHSGVEQHVVKLWGDDAHVCLEVIDEGRGFVPPDLNLGADVMFEDHIGLRGMRDRVELLGGSFQLVSRPGQGTRIRVEVPAYV
ncbi:MAG: sensor histidine kinase [Caldilineaceae bacterium]|nr:sensor histidine kinase [Caldilineaceae bacterium]